MKLIVKIETILHFFVGFGALMGGTGAVLNPDGPMGISKAALRHGPFDSFLVPGLFLLIILGVGNIVSGFISSKRSGAPYLHVLMGGLLAAWIVIQCLILWGVGFLHILFFLIGMVQFILGAVFLFKKDLFPMDFFKALFGH